MRLTKVADRVTLPLQITPEQMQAARTLLKWSRERLAAWSDVTPMFVRTYENEGRVVTMVSRKPSFDGMAAVRAILVENGVEFLEENGGWAGVRLRKASQ